MADKTGYIGRNPGDSAVTVARQTFSPTGVTTDFTFVSGYVPGYFDLFINGVKMIEGSDYTSTNGSTFTILNGGATNGDVIEGVAYKAFNAASVTNAGGDFTVGGNLTVTGSASFGSVAAGTSVSFATTAFNLDGTPDLTVRNLTGVAATFTGVVTYEDVTSIDSVGIITARSSIELGVSGAGGTITSAGNAEFAGIVTASDGRLIAGVGINSAGTTIGTGITTLNFIGTGNTFAVNGTTMDISIQGGGGGGGAELDVTASLFI